MIQGNRRSPADFWYKYRHFILILGLFTLTLVLRVNALREPVKGSHTWLSAHTVMTLKIWQEEGIGNYHFSPVYTYENSADKHLRSLASGLSDEDGNYYYVSYPPFSFLLAYAFIEAFHLEPSMTSLQFLNLLIHLTTSWLLYVILCRLFEHQVRSRVNYPAMTAAVLYLFSAQALWCHAYMYFADSVVQLLWVAGLLLAFEILFCNKGVSWLYLSGLGVTLFLACYTEWLGYFFVATLFLVAARFSIDDRIYLRVVFVSVVATLLAFSLTLYQYAQINGLSAFIDASMNKYLDRSGYQTNHFHYVRLQLFFVLRHYWRLHLPYMGLFIFLLLALFTQRERPLYTRKRERRTLFFLILLPIVLHHGVFLEFSKMHDFALLKTLIFFCVSIAVLLHRNLECVELSQQKNFAVFSGAFIVILIAVNLMTYFKYDAAVTSDRFRLAAEAITSRARNNDTIYFVSQGDRDNGLMVFMGSERAFSPQVQLLSGRNTLAVKDIGSAQTHLQRHNLQQGIVFSLSSQGLVTDTLHIPSR